MFHYVVQVWKGKPFNEADESIFRDVNSSEHGAILTLEDQINKLADNPNRGEHCRYRARIKSGERVVWENNQIFIRSDVKRTKPFDINKGVIE